MGYESLYFCEGVEADKQVRQHLQKMYGVEDKDSLIQACFRLFSGSREYEQFMTFWKDAPLFDIKELHPEGRSRFESCRELAESFYPFVEEKGFYAWDINERIGLCRNAAACGIISAEEFWQITDEWDRQAQVFYHSYGEYIGYMYHDEPHPDYPDSGWRFFVGDEPDEYIDDPDNTAVCGLNTICNLFPDVMAYLHAEEGRRFGRQEHGWEEE